MSKKFHLKLCPVHKFSFENFLERKSKKGPTPIKESLPGAAPTIPADVPTLPLIASQTPIFPKFIRIIEIQGIRGF